jgi:hypothetical protein
MKSYRCVFSYSGGNTTIEISAADGEQAIAAAASAINAGDYDRVEVWDGEDLVMERTTPRAWDTLGDDAPPSQALTISSEHAMAPTGPLPQGLPRRAPTMSAAVLRGPRIRRSSLAARKS